MIGVQMKTVQNKTLDDMWVCDYCGTEEVDEKRGSI